MIEVSDLVYLDKVMSWAKSHGLADQLQGKLDYLSSYSGRPDILCKLYPDFAPHSFRFAMYLDGNFWFNGGLIYQGPDCPADGSAPSFTVSLADGVGWFIHT